MSEGGRQCGQEVKWLAERKRKRKKGDERERPDWIDNLEKRLMDAMVNQSEVVLKRMEYMEENMDLKIEGIRVVVQNSVERIKTVEHKTKSMEKEMKEKMTNCKRRYYY